MAKPFKVLYVGPAKTAAGERPSLEQQSRAIQLAGGTVVRYEGQDTPALLQALRDVDVAMLQGHGFDRAAFAQMGLNGRCQGLVSFGHGFDHLDLDEATRNGVVLANTASFGTEEVSNHTMMHFLVCSRTHGRDRSGEGRYRPADGGGPGLDGGVARLRRRRADRASRRAGPVAFSRHGRRDHRAHRRRPRAR